MKRLTALGLVLVFAGCSGCYSEEFSAGEWQRTPQEKREAMAKDFIKSHFRVGMTRAEVVGLLGASDPGFPQELQYIVGSAGIDYRVLWIQLDANGKAVSAKIYQTS